MAAKLSLEDWYTESLRFTLFISSPPLYHVGNYWEEVTGVPPEERKHRPRLQTETEEGEWLTGRLRVESAMTRIDWKLLAEQEEADLGLPSLGQFSEMQSRFGEKMHEWLGKCPPASRIAYGCVLLLPATSQKDANEKLNDLLPSLDLDSDTVRDLIFRINRRRKSESGLENMEINRISTWMTANVVRAYVEVPSEAQGGTQVTQVEPSSTVCRLELDINSIPEYGSEIEKEKLPDLFEELLVIANEIATEGDIA